MPFSFKNFNTRQRFLSTLFLYQCYEFCRHRAIEETNIVFEIRQAVSTMPVQNEYVKDFYEIRGLADVGILL